MTPSPKVMSAAAKLAQWRAESGDLDQIKAARLGRRCESVWPLIRRYVTDDDLQKLRKRGCLHVADFPEKSNLSLRIRGRRRADAL